MTNYLIRFFNIIIAAILAGASFGIWIGFNPMGLSSSAYVEQQQNMLQALRVVLVILVFAATAFTITSAILQRKNRGTFTALTLAALFFIACILITRFGNKPIDDFMMTWTSSSLPNNWTYFRDTWWSFHILRTIAELAALCLVTLASISKR